MKHALAGARTSWVALAGMVGALCLLAAYLIACHVATTQQMPWALWLYLAPVLAMLFSVLATRLGAIVGGAIILSLVCALAYGLPLWRGDRSVLYVVQHVCTNLALCWLFGQTLLPGREPLVTRFARIMRRGDMPDEVLAFTRSTTWAWTMFFALISVISVGLYVSASIEAWSTFANLINSPLIGLMFVGEYAVRRYKLRGIRHSGFMDAIQAFRQPWSASKSGPHSP